MGNRRKRTTGPQGHAEGQHGAKTHRRFVEQLHESVTQPVEADREGRAIEGHHRLHQDRQQHDEAEKDSEKTRAIVVLERGDVVEMVIAHARVPPSDLK
jgi:hypothetical protein